MRAWGRILFLVGVAAGLSASGLHWGILNSIGETVGDLKTQVAESRVVTPMPSPTISTTFTVSPTFSISPTSSCTRTRTPTTTMTPSATPTASVTPTSTPFGPLSLAGSMTLTAGTYYFTSIHILSGGNLHIVGTSAVDLEVGGNVLLDSGALIDGTANGYGSTSGPGYVGAFGYYATVGAGHGGPGGADAYSSAVGPTYDNANAPVIPGSGTSGSGGAALVVHASGDAILNGSIRMDAFTDTSLCGGGGGSGGAVYITAQNISGTGSISANGSPGGDCPVSGGSDNNGGGGGGGGRVNLCPSNSLFFSGTVTVLGAAGGSGLLNGYPGSKGTYYNCSTSAPTPTPLPTVGPSISMLKSCNANYWFGHLLATLSMFNGAFSACTGMTCPSIADALSGDTSVEGIVATNGGGTSCAASGPWTYSFGVYAPSSSTDASSYQAAGHLNFDLQLGIGAVSSINVSIGNAYPSTITASLSLIPSNYSSSSFTRVSLPLSSFSPDVTHGMNMPFCITIGMVSPPAANATLFYVDDVRWTQN